MEKDYSKLLRLIKGSKNILITSHISPDPDAISSALGLFNILNQNFKRNIIVNFEDPVNEKYSFLKGFKSVRNTEHIEIVKEEDVDLIIVLDGNNWRRFVKKSWEKFKSKIENSAEIKTVCIDHHPKIGFDKFDLYIQKNYGSTTEIIYEILIENFKFKMDKDFAYAIMTGIIGDTGRFMYAKDLPKTFDIAKELIAFDEQMIEKITTSTGRYKLHTLQFLQELIKNTVMRDEYTFSFFSEKTTTKVRKDPSLAPMYKSASEEYVNIYVRNIEDNLWGFSVTPIPEELGSYKVSFRATVGTVDSSIFAAQLGGGGHKGASGCEFKAENIEEAIQIVEKTIRENIQRATL
jgi:phosphoesterase RecJ-like protein